MRSERNNKYFYQIVSAADSGIPPSVQSTSYKSQIDGSEVKQIDQVKIFHLLASVVFNHFSLQILTKIDAENVPSTITFNPRIIFILIRNCKCFKLFALKKVDYLQLPLYICTAWASTIFTDKSILPTLSNQYLGWQGLTRRILSQQGWKTNTTNITTTSPISRLWCEMSARSLTPHQMLVLLHNLQQKLPTECTETISVSVVPCQYIIYIKVINPRFRLWFILMSLPWPWLGARTVRWVDLPLHCAVNYNNNWIQTSSIVLWWT